MGHVTIEQKNLGTLTSGAKLELQIFKFKGHDDNAPSTYIQSTIHGSEVQGYYVSLILIEYFAENQPTGNVTIVPIANPYGVDCKVGDYTLGKFDLNTGNNWNRKYFDYSILINKFLNKNLNKNLSDIAPLFKKEITQAIENALSQPQEKTAKLALNLQYMASQANIVLDLHCDTISVEHIYSPSYAIESAKKFGIPFIVEIKDKFFGAMDEAIFYPWVQLINAYSSTYINNVFNPDIEAFTLELGSQEIINKNQAKKQASQILSYLGSKGICNHSQNQNTKIYSCTKEDFISITAPQGGIIIDYAPLGKIIKPGLNLIEISSPSRFYNLNNNFRHIIDLTTTRTTLDYPYIPIARSAGTNAQEGMVVMKGMTNFKEV